MVAEGARMADGSKLRHPQHSSHEKCSVGERLHSRVHVCNHARCAANDPDYNVKSAVPLKKFLVAKKHAYGGLEEKGERKRTGSVSTTISAPDHGPDRKSHALKSLTNSESGSYGNGKARSNGLRSNAHSAVQSRRATRDNSSISSEARSGLERKARPIASHSSCPVPSATRRRSVAAAESYSTAQRSRLSSAGSIYSTQGTERSKQCEDSASPESSVTSIRITQFISRRREEKEGNAEDEAQELLDSVGAASSPRASVGSNQDTEISSLKENVIDFEQFANSGDLKSPVNSSSNVLQENSGNREPQIDSLSPSSPSVDGNPRISESLTPSAPSPSFASSTPERSSLTATTPASELSSSILSKAAVGEEEIHYGLSSPSVDSGPTTTSGSLTSSVISLKSGPQLSSGSTRRSSRTTTPPSPSGKFGANFTTSLKESSNVGSPSSSSSRASANRPSRIPRTPVVAAAVASSPAPTNPSRLAKKFITDLQERSVSRRSTKGVRSIELRGGKAQSYSTTTVTSWNMTTTTVETSLSISEITTEKTVESELAESGSVLVSVEPEQLSKKESQPAAAIPGPNAFAADPKAMKEASAPGKFAKNARSFEEVHADAETVSLKHGEVAGRRLSEEYMTNHALEGVVRKISENDHRVKVLVHAFETLATLDPEALAIEATTLGHDLAHESLSATTIAV